MDPDKITKRYSHAYMSNTKWRKLFRVLHVENITINRCLWKLVTEPEPIAGYLPNVGLLGDTYVGDCGALNGPFDFREIEWIRIPREHSFRPYEGAPLESVTQDLDTILEQIESLGKFEVSMNEDGLTIYGYRP